MQSDRPRLYLVTQPVADGDALAPTFAEVLGAGDIACVLLRLAARDDAAAKKIVKRLAGIAAVRDVALLLEADPKLAARAGADGVHVRGSGPDLRDALASLKPERIVGCGGLKLRDDAMRAGEAGVDYVMFGEPTPDRWVPPFDDTIERVEWWATIFNVPCVGYASRLDDVAMLAAAGADFVALEDCVWTDPRGAVVAVREADAALKISAAAG